MSKECPGKYHGKAIKYIKDDEKYCKICQQEISLRKKRRNETIAGVVTFIVTIGGIILGGKSKSKGKNKKNK